MKVDLYILWEKKISVFVFIYSGKYIYIYIIGLKEFIHNWGKKRVKV